MIPIFYGSILAASLLCSVIYVYTWHKHFNVNISLIFTFIPVACLGHFLYSVSGSMGEAVLAQKVIYLGSSFLQLFVLFSILDLCQIDIKKWMRTLLFLVCSATYLGVLSIGYADIFYRNISYTNAGGVSVLSREYGWMHTAYYAVVVLLFALGLGVICFSWLKKRQVPRTIILLLVLPYAIALLTYFVGRAVYDRMDLMPLGYLLAQVIYVIISARMNLYDVADTVVDSMVQEQVIGYISFDFRYRYLGSNETARRLVPALEALAVDDVLGSTPAERRIRHYLDSFQKDPERNRFTYTLHSEDGDPDRDRIYDVNVSFLYDGDRKRGYMVTYTDDTANRKYIRLLDTYNEKLQREVEEKTRHIVEMHDNLVMSMAMMVESRDNSTGGHIKRTSEGVRVLVDELKRTHHRAMTEEFCRDIIKAAPMHDLGKIAVDDAILRKAGRFTPEEYDKMKQHSAQGAKVIHEILLQTDDESFKGIAENVAHYHHERWDGRGYPEGLSGEQIPFEARIMAIADVYDALVSKRVYKEAFDFEKANDIILEGFGTQFDPGLKTTYEVAKPKLEEYYKSINT